MPSTNDYFTNLKLQAEAAANAKKQALDTAYQMATAATVNKDTGEITYATDATGKRKYGTADVAYEETKRNRAAQGEGSGMLRSGQLAREKLTDESDYRSRIMGLAADTAAQKSQIDLDTATQVAEYRALYGGGTSGAGGGTSASSPTTPATSVTKPVTAPPTPPSTAAAPKPTYQDPSIRNRATTIAPVKSAPKPVPVPKKAAPAKPTTAKPAPKPVVPKRIGGY